MNWALIGRVLHFGFLALFVVLTGRAVMDGEWFLVGLGIIGVTIALAKALETAEAARVS